MCEVRDGTELFDFDVFALYLFAVVSMAPGSGRNAVEGASVGVTGYFIGDVFCGGRAKVS